MSRRLRTTKTEEPDLSYAFKVRAVNNASLEASIAYDTAHEALGDETVPKTDDYGECLLCGAAMYYCLDYTHAEDCPVNDVERMHGLLQDALKVLDDAMAKKLIAAGREAELLPHPLDRFVQLPNA